MGRQDDVAGGTRQELPMVEQNGKGLGSGRAGEKGRQTENHGIIIVWEVTRKLTQIPSP